MSKNYLKVSVRVSRRIRSGLLHYLPHQLVLGCYLHQPESHQQSLNYISDTPRSDKNRLKVSVRVSNGSRRIRGGREPSLYGINPLPAAAQPTPPRPTDERTRKGSSLPYLSDPEGCRPYYGFLVLLLLLLLLQPLSRSALKHLYFHGSSIIFNILYIVGKRTAPGFIW